MSQGTFSDTLIQLEALKRIFVFRLKTAIFSRVFSQKWLNYEDSIFHLFMSLGISEYHKIFLGIIFSGNNRRLD